NLSGGPETRCFVDLEAHAMPEVVHESRAAGPVSSLFEEADHRAVDLFTGDAGANRFCGEVLGVPDRLEHLKDIGGWLSTADCTAHIAVVAGLLVSWEDVDHDRFVCFQRPLSPEMGKCALLAAGDDGIGRDAPSLLENLVHS